MTDIKFKPLTKEQIIISLDRLTRFKHPEDKYLRVFKDILTHNLITPKFSKSDLGKMEYKTLRDYAQRILNESVNSYISVSTNYETNKKLLNYEKSLFKIDEHTEKLLNNEINYEACVNFISDNTTKNLQWLKILTTTKDDIEERQKNSLHYPIEKLIITEGATEETLLPVFARLCNYDFDKNGIHLIAAGGKNQVVKLFYELVEKLNIPIYVLLDKDGYENAQEIAPRLRSIDKIHIISCGEFEVFLPV